MKPDAISLAEETKTLVDEAAKQEGVSPSVFVEQAVQDRLAALRRGASAERRFSPAKSPKMTQEEWRSFIFEVAGSSPDPSFRRHDQGTFEQRGDLP